MVFLMKRHTEEAIINLGTGHEVSIADLAALICRVVGYVGRIHNDQSQPDGRPRKVVDTARLRRLGWRARASLEERSERTYRWYSDRLASTREPALVRI